MSKNKSKLDMCERVFQPAKGVEAREFDFSTLSKIIEAVFPSPEIRKYWKKSKFVPSIEDIAFVVSKNGDKDLVEKILIMRSLLKFATKDTKKKIESYLEKWQELFEDFQKRYTNTVFELQEQYQQDDGTFGSPLSVGVFEDISTLFNTAIKLQEYEKNQNSKYIIYKRIILKENDFKDIQEESQVPETIGCMYFTSDGYLESMKNREPVSSIDFSDAICIGSFCIGGDGPFDNHKFCYPTSFGKGDVVHDIVSNEYGVIFQVEDQEDYECTQMYCICENGQIAHRLCHAYNLVSVKDDNSPRYSYLRKLSELASGKVDPVGFTYALERYHNNVIKDGKE